MQISLILIITVLNNFKCKRGKYCWRLQMRYVCDASCLGLTDSLFEIMSQNHFLLDQTVFWTFIQQKQGFWDRLELESCFLGNVPAFVFINEEGFSGEGLTEGALLNWCWPMSELSVKLHREHYTSTLSLGFPLTSMNQTSSTEFQHHRFWPTNVSKK